MEIIKMKLIFSYIYLAHPIGVLISGEMQNPKNCTQIKNPIE